MKTQLDLHVYAGLLAAFLVIVHSAHKFDSLMDIALMKQLLLLVVGGYAVRHLLIFVGHEVKDWRARLETGLGDLDHAWGVLETTPAETRANAGVPVVAASMVSRGFDPRATGPAREVTRIGQSVADLEHSVPLNEGFTRWCGRFLKLHIAVAVVFGGCSTWHEQINKLQTRTTPLRHCAIAPSAGS